jgi:predicted transcriptional regulator
MEQTNFTCRVDSDLKQAFLRAAKANDRPASVLIRDFMRDYIQRSIQGQQTSLPFDYRAPEREKAPC